VMCLAWKHRGESPVIVVETSPDGTDMSAPHVKMVPRSEWGHSERWTSGRATIENLSHFFERDGFDAAKEYYVLCVPQHPVWWCRLNPGTARV
jgi:hypothetical protein